MVGSLCSAAANWVLGALPAILRETSHHQRRQLVQRAIALWIQWACRRRWPDGLIDWRTLGTRSSPAGPWVGGRAVPAAVLVCRAGSVWAGRAGWGDNVVDSWRRQRGRARTERIGERVCLGCWRQRCLQWAAGRLGAPTCTAPVAGMPVDWWCLVGRDEGGLQRCVYNEG